MRRSDAQPLEQEEDNLATGDAVDEELAEVDPRFVKQVRILSSVACVVLTACSIGLGWFAATRCVRLHEKSGTHYLNSYGIGAREWAVLSMMVCCYMAARFCSVESIQALSRGGRPQSKGLTQTRLRVVFGRPESGSVSCVRAGKVFVVLLRGMLNTAFICKNMSSLPPRDPTERLNEARHAVAWFELPMMCFVVLALLQGLCTKNPERPANAMRILARLSALQAINAFSIDRLGDLKKSADRKDLGCVATALAFMMTFAGGCAGVASLLVKVSSVDFVAERIYWKWTPVEYFYLASFVNCVVGIWDLRKLSLNTLGKQLAEDTCESHGNVMDKWLTEFAKQLSEVYGLAVGGMIFMTFDISEVVKLMSSRPLFDLSEKGIECEASQFIEHNPEIFTHPKTISHDDELYSLPEGCAEFFNGRPVYYGSNGSFMFFAADHKAFRNTWVVSVTEEFRTVKSIYVKQWAHDQSVSPLLVPESAWSEAEGRGCWWSESSQTLVERDDDDNEMRSLTFVADDNEMLKLQHEVESFDDELRAVLKSAKRSIAQHSDSPTTRQSIALANRMQMFRKEKVDCKVGTQNEEDNQS